MLPSIVIVSCSIIEHCKFHERKVTILFINERFRGPEPLLNKGQNHLTLCRGPAPAESGFLRDGRHQHDE